MVVEVTPAANRLWVRIRETEGSPWMFWNAEPLVSIRAGLYQDLLARTKPNSVDFSQTMLRLIFETPEAAQEQIDQARQTVEERLSAPS